MAEGLVYVGKIIEIGEIPNADFICSATVVCGAGGKWKGIIKKTDFKVDDLCLVYLPDAVIPESEDMMFMASSHWRVKMRRFRGAPSEVVIVPLTLDLEVGTDCTSSLGVLRYIKPVPVHLQGMAKGLFPEFIPKTDEPNYQRPEAMVEVLVGKPYYVSLKMDGSSTTAYKWKGEFGVCSRNLELKEDPNNGYWKIALKYDLPNKLPEGYALQWETCGPGIQSNPMGLAELSGFAFSAYKIDEHRYLTWHEFLILCLELGFPRAEALVCGEEFQLEGLEFLGEGKYTNGHQREGVVVRSQENVLGHKPVSFKVINLNYEK